MLKQASLLLANIDDDNVKKAKEQIEELDKQSAIGGLVSSPEFHNIVNLLTPFVVNYKINQVLKLLKEVAKEGKEKYYPGTTVRKLV